MNNYEKMRSVTHQVTPYGYFPKLDFAIKQMLVGWAEYADAHKEQFDSPIGGDYVLGPAWEAIGDGLLTLLNGETGDFLVCGDVDRAIREIGAANGLTGETWEVTKV